MISTKGRYALRILLDIAEREENGFVPLKDVALRQNISLKYAESVLSLLVAQKLAEGTKGRGGGYRLALPPDQIDVERVLLAAEGDLAPVACLADGQTGCVYNQTCKTLPLWKALQKKTSAFLSSVTLSDLLEGKLTDFS